jgi:hypothetical protein
MRTSVRPSDYCFGGCDDELPVVLPPDELPEPLVELGLLEEAGGLELDEPGDGLVGVVLLPEPLVEELLLDDGFAELPEPEPAVDGVDLLGAVDELDDEPLPPDVPGGTADGDLVEAPLVPVVDDDELPLEPDEPLLPLLSQPASVSAPRMAQTAQNFVLMQSSPLSIPLKQIVPGMLQAAPSRLE